MKKYVCSVCGYVYDGAKGAPGRGIAPGTRFEDLPADWSCPLCAAPKSEFKEQGGAESAPEKPAARPAGDTGDIRELSAPELSVVCSNLARGCEKQYKFDEEALFRELAQYFASVSQPAPAADFGALEALVESDVEGALPAAFAQARADSDRGALRALTWSDKVTRILRSILQRYAAEGDAMLENTGVYVCTICGFIYIGGELPELCPVCKVPNWKFEKIEGGK